MQPEKSESKPRLTICVAIIVAALASIGLLWSGGKQSSAPRHTPRGYPSSSETTSPLDFQETAFGAASVDSIPDGQPDLIPIPLRNVVGTRDRDSMEGDEVMRIMPRGKQFFGAIEFLIEGVVNLDGAGSSQAGLDFRKRVTVSITPDDQPAGDAAIQARGQGIACLHLVGATRFSSEPGETFAEIVWHYTDGTSSHSPVRYAVHMRDWWRKYFEQPPQLTDPATRVAWKQPHPTNKDRSIRLYRVTVANPQPKRTIKNIEFVGGMSRPGLFFIALTLDRLRLGQRPDDLSQEEMPDPELPGLLRVQVQTAAGLPIANANVNATARDESSRPLPATPSVSTDINGMAEVKFQNQKLGRLEVGATHDDYAGRMMRWDVKAGDQVPGSFVFQLSQGITIGGTVVDESNYALSGVKLSFYRFWTGDDDMGAKGEQFEFRNKTVTTDGAGAWQLRGVPGALMERIGFRVEHADFVTAQVQLNNDAKAEKELRAGTHRLVLKRGLEAWGMVMDEKNQPVANAKVSAGQRYSSDRKSATTDVRGQFYLKPLAEGDVTFSATAAGFAPESKTQRVQPGMAPVYFNLAAGSSIRGIVVDESNVPISGVRVMLQTWGGPEILPYEFNATTKADGRFEWDSAPNKALRFQFYKDGYASVNDRLLEPGKDNVITLKPPQTIKGIVLDDATGRTVAQFRAGVGSSFSSGSFVNNHDGMKAFASATGEFEFEVSAHYHDAIKVEADGFAEQIKKFAKESGQPQTLTFRLKAGHPLSGMVVNSQGSPVAGAQVAMISGGMGGLPVGLTGTKLQSYGSGTKIATTGEDGRFTLGTPPEGEDYSVIAASPEGVGRATVQQVRATGFVVIQSNGRIEGTLRVAGQLASGHSILFTLHQQGIQTDFNRFRTTTDDAGKFIFDDVPAGEGTLVRLVQTEQNSWLHSHNTPVMVEPGQTVHVALGDSGAVVRGRMRYETPPEANATIRVNGNLSTTMPSMPKFSSSEEAQAFMSSPEWKDHMKAIKHFGFVVAADGSFQMDSVPPGNYTLSIHAYKPGNGTRSWGSIPVANASMPVTVPESASPYFPIDVGEVLLKTFSQPALGN